MSINPPRAIFEPVQGSTLSKKDAVVVGGRLQEIEQQHGAITPARVLTDARSPSSPLHSFFEWDDAKAAEEHRLERARYLIRSVRITVQATAAQAPLKVRAFVKVTEPVKGTAEPGFVGTIRAMSNEDHRREVVQRALKELEDWSERHRHLSEFADVFEAVEETRKRFDRK